MEIRLRSLVAALIVLVLVGTLVYLTLPRLLPLATQLRLGPAATATSPTPVAAPTGGPDITYLDDSLGWDWDATCGPQLRQFLADQLPGRRISAVEIVLVDDTPERKLPFGVRYPDAAGAQADANCYDMGGGVYTCQVGVARGESGPNLDVAATLAAPYTLLDMFLARGADPDAIRRTWRWGTFQPLLAPVEEVENQWYSTCVRVSRAP